MLPAPPITIAASRLIECPKLSVSGEVYCTAARYRKPLAPPYIDAIVKARTLVQ